MSTIKPLHDRVVIKMVNETQSGIILPEQFNMNNTKGRGRAVAVADSLADQIKVGDMVLFENFGQDIEHEGEKCRLIHEQYIHGVEY